MDVEKLVAKIDGDITGLRAALQEAGVLTAKTTGNMGKQWKAVAGPVGAAEKAINGLKLIVGVLAVRELYQATRSSLEFSASIKDVSIQTNTSIEALQELRYAASQLGVDASTLDGALTRMTVTIGKARLEGGESAKVFRRLGLDVASIGDGDEALGKIIDRLQQIEDPTQRAAQAFQIFGREAGPKFMQFIDQGTDGINKLRAAARELGAVIGEDIVLNAAAANDKLAALDQVLKAQLTQTLVNLAPGMVGFAGYLADWSRWAAEAAQGLGILVGRLAVGSDIPFEQDLIDMREQAERTRATIERLLDIVEQDPSQGAKYGPMLEKLDAQLQGQEARIQELIRLQGEYFEMKPHAQEPAKAATVVVPTDVAKRQADLMRAIADDTARVGAEMSAHTIENFMAIDDGVRVSFEQALAHQRNYYATAQSLEASRYEQQLADFNESAENLALSREERHIAEQQMQSAHEGRMVEITRESQEARTALERAAIQQRIDGAKFVFDQLSALQSTRSRKLFEIGKAAAIGHGLINAYEAILAAYRWGSELGGPALGATFAAAAGVAQFANLAKLKSVQFGGGGGSKASAAGGGAVGEAAAPGGGGAGASRVTLISLPPGRSFYSTDELRALLEQLSEGLGDGGKLEVVS